MVRKYTLVSAVLLLVAIGLAPVVAMFVKSLFVDGKFSLTNYGMLFQSGRQWQLLFNSLLLASSTTLLAVFLGVPLGTLLVKTDLPLRKFFFVLFAVPLIIPPYILAIAWFYCLGRSGIVASIFGPKIAVTTSQFLFGFPGTLFVMVSTLLPVVIILVATYLRMVNPKLEEAAKLSTGWLSILKNISIPVIAPGILLSALIVFILALGEFGVPSFLRFNVFSVESFLQFSAFYNFNAATAAAIPLAMIILGILIIERLFLRRKTAQFKITKEPIIIVPLKKTKLFLFSAVSILASVFVLVPVGVLFIKSFSHHAYGEALVLSADSMFRSLLYALIGATCLLVLGFLLGYVLERKALRFSYAADSIAIFLFALPGTVIGIGLTTLWNTPATNIIYASTAIILFGYIARYTALAARFMAVTFSQVPRSMEEAAQIVGASWPRRLSGILVPLAKRGMIGAWLIGFIFCLRDLDITMMVYPPAHDTLPVRIFTLMANTPEEIIAALCVIMIVITLLPLGILGLATKYAR